MSSLITIPKPKKVTPLHIIESAKRCANSYDKKFFDGLTLPEVPPRSVSVICDLLVSGNTARISLLEWVKLFEAGEYFDTLDSHKASSLISIIWEQIATQMNVRQLAFWRMCLYFDGQSKMIPKPLMDKFRSKMISIKSVDLQRSLLLIALDEKNENDIAYYALQTSVTPKTLFFKRGLPNNIQLLTSAKEKLENVLSQKGLTKFVDNYLQIISAYSAQEQDQAVTRLADKVETAQLIKSHSLLHYLKDIYSPNKLNSRWGFLTSSAQESLRGVFGVAYFTDFKTFIFQLTSPKLTEALSLTSSEVKQLRSRVTFWSNYQSRIQNFKVFLPLKTSQTIKSFGLNLPDHSLVSRFTSDREVTELCLIEFEQYIVVEYLRGGLSSARIYNKSYERIQSILTVNKLNVDFLNVIDCEKEHDHLVFWQHSCEKMLREEFKILPGSNLKRFLIVDGENQVYKIYDKKRGLPPLDFEQKRKRAEALKRSKFGRNSQTSESQRSMPQLGSNFAIGDKFIDSNRNKFRVINITTNGHYIVYNGEHYQTFSPSKLDEMKLVLEGVT